MEWKKLGTKIAQAALLLGSLIVKPPGMAVDPVRNLIAETLGLAPPTASPEEISWAISQNPETLSKLRQFENRHEAELQKLSGSSKPAPY